MTDRQGIVGDGPCGGLARLGFSIQVGVAVNWYHRLQVRQGVYDEHLRWLATVTDTVAEERAWVAHQDHAEMRAVSRYTVTAASAGDRTKKGTQKMAMCASVITAQDPAATERWRDCHPRDDGRLLSTSNELTLCVLDRREMTLVPATAVDEPQYRSVRQEEHPSCESRSGT